MREILPSIARMRPGDHYCTTRIAHDGPNALAIAETSGRNFSTPINLCVYSARKADIGGIEGRQ